MITLANIVVGILISLLIVVAGVFVYELYYTYKLKKWLDKYIDQRCFW